MDDNNIYEIYIIYALHALLLLCAYTSIYIIYINVLFLHAFYRHDGFPPPPPLHPSPRPFTSYFYIHRVRAAQRPIYRGIRRAYSCVQLPKRASGYKNNARSNHKSTPVFSSIKKGKKKKGSRHGNSEFIAAGPTGALSVFTLSGQFHFNFQPPLSTAAAALAFVRRSHVLRQQLVPTYVYIRI